MKTLTTNVTQTTSLCFQTGFPPSLAGWDVHLLGDDGHVFALSSFLAHEQMHKSCFVFFSISEVAVVRPECNPAVALTNE